MTSDCNSGPEKPLGATVRRAVPSKTPAYTAINAQRYYRQVLIRDIEKETGRKLICIVSGLSAQIDRDDTAGFVDLLHNLTPGEPVDLLLHTPGGDIDAAEKLVTLLRAMAGEDGSVRVVVPEFAKSAGTLMALGANRILMSDTSELGTIDPQIWLRDATGNEICHSVLNYIKSYDEFSSAVRKDPSDPVFRTMFDRFDPLILRKFITVRDRARDFAENQLKRLGVNYSKIANDLLDVDRFPSHGQMIGWEAAIRIGLQVDYLPMYDPLWRRYWELYCHQRLAVKETQKLFESPYVSLVFED